MTPNGRVLTAVVCGAGPAAATGTLVKLAHDRGWTVQVVATPAALEFFDEHACCGLLGYVAMACVTPAVLGVLGLL